MSGKSELTNTNKLIRNYKGATGLKTGSTGLALYNLSASATRDNLSLIAVIMKAPSTKVRFAEAQKLLDYGFSNYSYVSFAKKDDILTSLPVTKGTQDSVNIVYSEDSGSLLKKGQEKNLEQVVSLPEIVEAPILKGEQIGEVKYLLDGQIVGITPLVSDKEIKKISLSNMTEFVFFSWFRLLR